MRAISSLSREVGISARSCIALLALRMRVSMSAIGSVCIRNLSPARLGHARDRALMREIAQADAAEPELPEDRARAAAAVAARVLARLVARLAGCLGDQGLLGHYWSLLSAPANGRPRARRSAIPCSSFSAVVVIATSRPRTAGIES